MTAMSATNPDNRLRVLIADDQLTFRSAIRVALDSIPWVELVGSANDGQQAVDMAAEFEPDVVALDVEMPVMNGLDALKIIRSRHPRTSVIMVSAFTKEGAAVTIQAMADGARDFIAKPDSSSRVANQEELRSQLAEKLGTLRHVKERRAERQVESRTTGSSSTPFAAPQHSGVHAVAIAASTGGPQALRQLFADLPEQMTVPIFVVQHMPEKFTTALAANLDKLGPYRVFEGEQGMPVVPGQAYLAPGGLHMTVRRYASGTCIELLDTEKEHHCRPAADVLFRSVANVYGGASLGVILTGMGQDGTLGLKEMKAQGCLGFAQDESSCVVYGMPKIAVREGVIDRSIAIEQMAEAIGATVAR